jgi:hypothetical protein
MRQQYAGSVGRQIKTQIRGILGGVNRQDAEDGPAGLTAHFLKKAREDGVAIFVSGVGVDSDAEGSQN